MIIKFNFNNNTYEHEIKNSILKIYSVPEEYSSDMIYISDYSNTTIEPYPSSDSSKTDLLYHSIINKSFNESYINEIINKLEGVTYAKS